MFLNINIGASFISYPGTNSSSVGYHYMIDQSKDPGNTPSKQHPLIGIINLEFTTMWNVLFSAMES